MLAPSPRLLASSNAFTQELISSSLTHFHQTHTHTHRHTHTHAHISKNTHTHTHTRTINLPRWVTVCSDNLRLSSTYNKQQVSYKKRMGFCYGFMFRYS